MILLLHSRIRLSRVGLTATRGFLRRGHLVASVPVSYGGGERFPCIARAYNFSPHAY